MKTVIIVATHKEYPMPSDPLYLPVQAGRALHTPLPYAGDDSGENISARNRTFCELTALYWAWKNLSDADAVGLCHYRRYLAGTGRGRFTKAAAGKSAAGAAAAHGAEPENRPSAGNPGFPGAEAMGSAFRKKAARILTAAEAEALLEQTPVLLPKKRNYMIETGYSQYVHAHHEEDLILTRRILEERYPACVPAFDRTLARRKGHRFNMFVMRRDLLDRYCGWLFEILFTLEERLDVSAYSDYDRRVFGFVAERLLDVWLETEGIPYRELPVLHLESQHWLKKGPAFLKRKFRGRK